MLKINSDEEIFRILEETGRVDFDMHSPCCDIFENNGEWYFFWFCPEGSSKGCCMFINTEEFQREHVDRILSAALDELGNDGISEKLKGLISDRLTKMADDINAKNYFDAH